MNTALNTAELLEKVLIDLPFYDLIRSQRVCTLWRDTITRSTTIRCKLFLSVDEVKERWAVVGNAFKSLRFIQLTPETVLPPPMWIGKTRLDFMPTAPEHSQILQQLALRCFTAQEIRIAVPQKNTWRSRSLLLPVETCQTERDTY